MKPDEESSWLSKALQEACSTVFRGRLRGDKKHQAEGQGRAGQGTLRGPMQSSSREGVLLASWLEPLQSPRAPRSLLRGEEGKCFGHKSKSGDKFAFLIQMYFSLFKPGVNYWLVQNAPI